MPHPFLGGGTTGGLGGIGAQQQSQGTAVKYEAVKGTDTLNKSGVTVNVSTKLHCISAGTNYNQNKSLEVSHAPALPCPALPQIDKVAPVNISGK